MHAVFITVPVRRPDGVGPMRPTDECVERVDQGEEGIIDPNAPQFRSILPEGLHRTESVDIDMGMVCRVDDIGEYECDLYKPAACRIWFRIPSLPPLEVELNRQDFMMLMSNTTQNFVRDMQSAQQNQIIAANQSGAAMRPQQ